MSRIQTGSIEKSALNSLSLWERVRVREFWRGWTWVSTRGQEEMEHFFIAKFALAV